MHVSFLYPFYLSSFHVTFHILIQENANGKKKFPCCGRRKSPKKIVIPLAILGILMLFGIGYATGYFTSDRKTTTNENTKDKVTDLFILLVVYSVLI